MKKEKQRISVAAKHTGDNYIPPQPQYKDLTFASELLFEEWLNNIHAKKIQFRNSGLDMDTMWIVNTGEIVHTNMQASIWAGRFVHPKYIAVGMPVLLWIDGQWEEIDVVESITENK